MICSEFNPSGSLDKGKIGWAQHAKSLYRVVEKSQRCKGALVLDYEEISSAKVRTSKFKTKQRKLEHQIFHTDKYIVVLTSTILSSVFILLFILKWSKIHNQL